MSPQTEVWADIHSRHPTLWEALRADALLALNLRGEGPGSSRAGAAIVQMLRLACVSDAFLAQALYRIKARLQALGIPVVPRLAHRLAMMIAGVSIGDPVVVAAGVYIMHGHVVIDGLTEIGGGVVLGPFVTIGLRAGNFQGPRLGDGVHVGTGAKIIGPVRVGTGAVVGAGAVVVDDVAPGTTVVGIPARPI